MLPRREWFAVSIRRRFVARVASVGASAIQSFGVLSHSSQIYGNDFSSGTSHLLIAVACQRFKVCSAYSMSPRQNLDWNEPPLFAHPPEGRSRHPQQFRAISQLQQKRPADDRLGHFAVKNSVKRCLLRWCRPEQFHNALTLICVFDTFFDLVARHQLVAACPH